MPSFSSKAVKVYNLTYNCKTRQKEWHKKFFQNKFWGQRTDGHKKKSG